MTENSRLDENINFVQNALQQYKQNENNKIIQFLHVTVLIILGILSKCNREDEFVVYIVIALLLMPFAYAFFYLSDLYGATVNVYTRLFQQEQELTDDNKALYANADYSFKKTRRVFVYCLFLIYAFIAIGLINMFTLQVYIIDWLSLVYGGVCLTFAYLMYNFNKFFLWGRN